MSADPLMDLADLVAAVDDLERAELERWIAEGWLAPAVPGREPRFARIDLARVELIVEMRRDLDIGDESIPVILSLIDQVHGLRRELKQVCAAIEAEEPEVRRRILERFAAARRTAATAAPKPGPSPGTPDEDAP